jgi:hypothetical protein
METMDYSKYKNLIQQIGIRKEARELEAFGWKVWARYLDEYDQPPRISKHLPDILAKQNDRTKIVKVETEINEDDKAYYAFRKYAKSRNKTFFYVIKLDKIGRRMRRYEEGIIDY